MFRLNEMKENINMIFLPFTLLYFIIQLKINILILLKEASGPDVFTK